jgi:hypothetical protein
MIITTKDGTRLIVKQSQLEKLFGKMEPEPYKRPKPSANPGIVARLIKIYDSLDEEMRKSWEISNLVFAIDPLEYFISINKYNVQKNHRLELVSEGDIEPPRRFAAMPGDEPGSIRCSFSTLPEGQHIVLFTHTVEYRGLGGGLTRYDIGRNPESPYMITDLEPGREYAVYAMSVDRNVKGEVVISNTVAERAMAEIAVVV